MKFYRLDWHTPTHFFGSCVLAQLYIAWQGYFYGIMITFLLGVAWEGLDEIFQGKWIMDPRGFDAMDVIVDLAGCLFGAFIVWLVR